MNQFKLFTCFIIVLLSMVFSIADLNDGLVAHYPFNGNALDESVNNNNAQVYNAVLDSDRFGIQNSAYSFDGTEDYIIVEND